MTKPFFSIIIPTLNEEKYLPHLLTDLASQSFRDFEVVVVDGHSEDNTVAKASKLAPKLPSLKVINSAKRHVCVQRNLGAKKANADTLVFMDADNRLPPYFLQGIKYNLESKPTDVASTWIQPEKPDTYHKTIAVAVNLYYDLLAQNLIKPGILESMVIIQKNVFQKISGFNINTNFGEGFDLIEAIISHNYQFKIYKEPQYTFSLRRLRRYGTIKALYTIALTQIQDIMGKKPSNSKKIEQLYPMLGGGIYEQEKTNRFVETIRTKLTSLKSKNKVFHSISQFYQDLLQD